MTKTFILTPDIILTDTTLTAQDIRVFLTILTFVKENKFTFILSRFAKRCKISSNQLQDFLDLFVYKEYLTSQTENNKITVELNNSVNLEKTPHGTVFLNSPCPYDYILLLRSSNSISPSPIGIDYVKQDRVEQEATTRRHRRIPSNTIVEAPAIQIKRKTRSIVGHPLTLSPKPKKVKILDAIKEVSITGEQKEIVTKWNDYGFKKFYIRDTKTFSFAMKYLRQLKNGRLFINEKKLEMFKRPYTHKEILKTIDNLNLAIHDPTQFGLEENDIRRLKNCTLGDFIFNPFNPYKSEFVKFLDEKLIDTNNKITCVLKRFFIRKVLGGIKPARGFSWYENSKFIEAGSKIKTFYTANKKLMRSSISGNGEEGFAKIVCEALVDDVGNVSQITPGFFSSELTFNRRIPAYLNKQGVLISKLNEKTGRTNHI